MASIPNLDSLSLFLPPASFSVPSFPLTLPSLLPSFSLFLSFFPIVSMSQTLFILEMKISNLLPMAPYFPLI